ncbi:MAG: transporter substrate-binding domain-containing protein, partial [Synergistaceae bacterium]|nr:transporter substrate-binding domain-containing protein [Synergistaceae bacterium]
MLILIIFGQVCAAAAAEAGQYTKLSELADQKIGVILGANHDIFIAEKIPDAKVEYIKDLSAATLALETGKIAAFANMLPTAIYLTHANQKISFITEPLKNDYNYASFTNSERGREICAQYEKFFKSTSAVVLPGVGTEFFSLMVTSETVSREQMEPREV